MSAHHENRCSSCRQATDPMRLYVKQIRFLRKSTGNVARSRTASYLCDECIELDPEYNLDPAQSPGNQSAAQLRIQERRAKRNG